MIGIYMIHNKINNKVYIGQTVDIDNRWMQHRSRLRCQNHENKHLQAAYNLYGEDAFEYVLLEECERNELNEKEIFYIQYYDSYKTGYNQDLGGQGCKGYKHSEDEILKMRQVQNPKAVLRLDSNLSIIDEWVSCSHAAKTLGFSARGIKACCNRENRQKTIGGFYWVYKEEYENNIIDWDYYLNINKSSAKRVSQFDMHMNLVKIWDSIYQSQVVGGYLTSEVSAVCNYRKRSYQGFIWRFTDEYTDEEYEKDCNTDFIKRPAVGAKAIARYDLSGNLMAIYESTADAVRKTGFSKSSIQACLYGKQEFSHDSVWKYNN